MKFKELKEKTAEELKEERRDLKLEMMNLRVQKASGQLENPARIKIVRRTIAKIETLLSEKKFLFILEFKTQFLDKCSLDVKIFRGTIRRYPFINTRK